MVGAIRGTLTKISIAPLHSRENYIIASLGLMLIPILLTFRTDFREVRFIPQPLLCPWGISMFALLQKNIILNGYRAKCALPISNGQNPVIHDKAPLLENKRSLR